MHSRSREFHCHQERSRSRTSDLADDADTKKAGLNNRLFYLHYKELLINTLLVLASVCAYQNLLSLFDEQRNFYNQTGLCLDRLCCLSVFPRAMFNRSPGRWLFVLL